MSESTTDSRWLAAMLPWVRAQLPPAPARILEIGCGPLGGFVPGLAADGYDVAGVDPVAPDGPGYHQVEIEGFDPPSALDVIVASTSLHHVGDLDLVLDKAFDLLVPGGVIVVLEWAREQFDEATARWCFDRVPAPVPGEHGGWLQHHREAWLASGRPWESYLRSWAADEGLHTGDAVVRALEARFEAGAVVPAPYLFADLADVTEADEQAAIDANLIQPTGIRYVGRRR